MRTVAISIIVFIAILFAISAQADVFNLGGTRNPATGTWTGLASLEFVPVDDPGNTNDPATGNLFGSVGYSYQIGKYEVTVGQYCQFLNAVAKTDSYGLYFSYMANEYPTVGITRSGSSGSYSYAVTGSNGGGANFPMFDTTWAYAARFCNWLHNGQPSTGIEDATTTEDGAYSLNGAINNTSLMKITRNPTARYFIPSENEWYKAAYYKGGGINQGYWLYPTQSNTAPGNILPDTGNNANFDKSDNVNKLTAVGTYFASSSPYGTFDQGGNIWEWNETAVTVSTREYRGGSLIYTPSDLASTSWHEGNPSSGYKYGGFRIACVPEPSTIALLTATLGGLLWWRRRF